MVLLPVQVLKDFVKIKDYYALIGAAIMGFAQMEYAIAKKEKLERIVPKIHA